MVKVINPFYTDLHTKKLCYWSIFKFMLTSAEICSQKWYIDFQVQKVIQVPFYQFSCHLIIWNICSKHLLYTSLIINTNDLTVWPIWWNSWLFVYELSGCGFEFRCSHAWFICDSHFNSTILVIIFWDLLMFYQIFLSLQVKRIVIISNKHGIYRLPHELPNDLGLRVLGN